MKFNILIVDDEDFYREIMVLSLESRGVNVFQAGNGAEAINFLQNKNNKIDLILLDMMMPLMDGAETLNMIREIENCVQIPIIFQTGSLLDSNQDRIKVLSNMYFIQKPYEIEDLMKMINKILS